MGPVENAEPCQNIPFVVSKTPTTPRGTAAVTVRSLSLSLSPGVRGLSLSLSRAHSVHISPSTSHLFLHFVDARCAPLFIYYHYYFFFFIVSFFFFCTSPIFAAIACDTLSLQITHHVRKNGRRNRMTPSPGTLLIQGVWPCHPVNARQYAPMMDGRRS